MLCFFAQLYDQKNDALHRIADALTAESDRILAVNEPEVQRGRDKGLTDAFIDRMVLTRERLVGIAEDTLVIFTSDNGPHKEGGHKPDFFDSNGPLRGYKRDLYEGGIRVPAIASWPGRIDAGGSSAEPLAFWDWLPTACELAGINRPEETDGVSFVPTLLGQESKQA